MNAMIEMLARTPNRRRARRRRRAFAIAAAILVVTSVTLEGALTSGQEVRVHWTVENRGDGPTTTAAWNDAVFRSRDLTFDSGEDLFLGYAPHDGVVAPGAGYSAAVTVGVPLGIAGPHFLFVVVDRGASNFEEGVVLDNQRATDGAFDVRLPEPADLVVERIDVPAEAFLGEAIELTRRLTNTGDHAVTGRWHDAVYLSSDAVLDAGDAFVGRFESRLEAPLVPGGGTAIAATAPVPAVRPGDFYAIVVADIFDQVPEESSSNNTGASAGRIVVRARSLLLDGGPLAIDLTPEAERFLELEIPDARTVRIRLDPESEAAWTELFVRYDSAPTAGSFDLRAEAIAQADQVVTIPETQAGRYFVLARATRGTSPPEPAAAQIEAFTIPFSVEETRPSRVGDAGRVTVTVRGSRFLEGASVRLRCDPGELVACTFCTTWEVKRSVDPNEKTGSDGAGGEEFVPARKPIRYRVHFENLASASGPASVVKITDPLDATTRIAGTDAPFRRGDVDRDAVRGLTDAVNIFNYLFLGGRAPTCFDAADVDDDGTIILTDGVFLLNFLFLGGPAPPPPGGDCGADATPDGLAPCASGC